MSNNLLSLRRKINSINVKVLDLFLLRKKLILKIVKLKKTSKLDSFDPVREFAIYSDPKIKTRLLKLSWSELFLFSYLIEEQIRGQLPDYPTWSKKAHLKLKAGNDIIGRINPLIVKVIRPKIFKQLKLKKSFNFLKLIE